MFQDVAPTIEYKRLIIKIAKNLVTKLSAGWDVDLKRPGKSTFSRLSSLILPAQPFYVGARHGPPITVDQCRALPDRLLTAASLLPASVVLCCHDGQVRFENVVRCPSPVCVLKCAGVCPSWSQIWSQTHVGEKSVMGN
jgi:hypothetical protein